MPSQPRKSPSRFGDSIELGNFSNVKAVGAGVFEYRIDLGLGYRVTLARTATLS